MAKDNNLTDFLTDLANTIRAKKGTSDLINPQDFSSEIQNIETGFEYPSQGKDVNFYDYDGTLLYAFTSEEAAELDSLPTVVPKHNGLTFDGWNMTLDEVKEAVTLCGAYDVGANYTTTDGKTKLYIYIPEGVDSGIFNFTVELHGTGNGSGDLTIDWGDGVVDTITGLNSNSEWDPTHTYLSPGYYCIQLDRGPSGDLLLGTANFPLLGTDLSKAAILRRVELGGNGYYGPGMSSNRAHYLWDQTFKDCYNLVSISIPQVTLIYDYAFTNCKSLKAVIFPRHPATSSHNSVKNNICAGCSSLKVLSIPKQYKYIYGFVGSGVSRAVIPFITGSNNFKDCISLQEVRLGESITQIYSSNFYGCTSLIHFKFPTRISSISEQAFANCSNIRLYDFSKATRIPTLDNINAFTGINDTCKILVPYNLYYQWKDSNNWARYADHIIMNYTPVECTSLVITADDLERGNDNLAVVTWTAITNGTILDGTSVENITLSGTARVNVGYNETAESVTKEVSYTFLGVTVTTSITQGAYIKNCIICEYNITSTGNYTLIYSSTVVNQLTAMYVDGVEVEVNSSYSFTTTGIHEVIFKFADDLVLTSLYNLFNNITTLTKADFTGLNMSGITSTSTSNGTARMFYGCTSLKEIILPTSIKYLGYYMFYNCNAVTSLKIKATTAPTVYGQYTWGTSSAYLGNTNRSKGINKCYVPVGATGYNGTYWASYLFSTNYCGFTKVESDEL